MKKEECRMQKENALRRVRHFFCLLPSAFCLLLVRLYQLILSPAKNALLGPSGHCRFEPSCSQYAAEALKTHGAVSGTWLAAKRICRCHPWGDFGEDPVPPAKVGTSRCDVSVRVRRTEQTSPEMTSAARTVLRAVPATKVPGAELHVSNAGIRI